MSEKTSRREFLHKSMQLLGSSLLLAACDKIPGMNMPETIKPEACPLHRAVATIFYIGEKAGKDNGYIDNISTEWDRHAPTRFGGVDNPKRRDARGLPLGFSPKENPFYFAVPASEFTEEGRIPGVWERSPWYQKDVVEAARNGRPFPEDGSRSLFKGRWIKVTNPANGQEVYGQWLDTGPGEDPSSNQDYDYVFGTGAPKKPFGKLGASLDVSPAMAHYLGFSIQEGGIPVDWQFVDEEEVPSMGPWRSKDFSPIDNYTYWN